MLAYMSFRSAVRPRVAVELALALLLAAQLLLWLVVLSAPVMEPSARAHLTLSVPTAATAGGADPFFAASGLEADVLPAHTLYAVRTGNRPGAILAGPDGLQKAVGLGDAVSDGVTLAAVGDDHVVLAHGRAQSRLGFPQPSAASFSPSPLSIETPGARVAAPAGGAHAATYETALRPVEAGGATEGYVWRPGTEGGILAAAGLRPGDVLLRINGTPFDRHERFEELAAEVAAGRPVHIDYRRNGSNYSARYPSD
jgi:general secretion pathway protein C